MQKGIQISRSNVYYFKHNDMEDLERVVKKIQEERNMKKLPLRRQFICVEGIYANIGDICNLPEILKIKEKYKFRLLIEESFSLGVLGSRGAGVIDHFNVSPSDVEIIVATMANSFGSGGGFCAGSKEIVEHQRLSGQAYTYSASLPAMLTVASIEALNYLEGTPNVVGKLHINSEIMLKALKKNMSGFQVEGFVGSAIFHVRIEKKMPNREEEEMILQEAVDIVFFI
jgi:serine palmitoyltransferase